MGAVVEQIQFVVTIVAETGRALNVQIGSDIRSRYWVPKSAIWDEKGKALNASNLCIGIVVKVRIAAWFAKKGGLI